MKFEEMNDIDITKWKEYSNVFTHSLWVKNEDFKHISTKEAGTKEYHGRYHPEIPYQMMLRYTKENDLVWDCFAGGGTTIDVAKRLNRRCIGTDLYKLRDDIIIGDAKNYRLNEKCKLVMMHPPYWDMIKFGDNVEDLSNKSLKQFIQDFDTIIKNVKSNLEEERICCLVISDKYKWSEQIALGSILYILFKKNGFMLKGKIIKNFGETKGTSGTLSGGGKYEGIWRYRALKGGFWKLGIDEIYIFVNKKNSKTKDIFDDFNLVEIYDNYE